MESKNYEQQNPQNAKSSYHDTTVILNAFNSEKEDVKNKFFNPIKIVKLLLLITMFISMTMLIYAYSKLSETNIVGNILGRNYSEIVAIPIISILNTCFISFLIKNTSKTTYTLGKKTPVMLMHLLNLCLWIVLPILMLYIDISSNEKWVRFFLFIMLYETIRMLFIYLFIFIKNYSLRKMFPIEVSKTKRMTPSLMAMIPFVMLYLFVMEKRLKNNSKLEMIILSLIVVFAFISLLVAIICSIWSSKIENRANSFIEEEEQQSTTIMSYILTILVAPFFGIAAANLKQNTTFNYWIITAIIISIAMVGSYLYFVITDYKKNKERQRTPMMNSIIISSHLFINLIVVSIMALVSTNELERWNYVFLIIFSLFTFTILFISILFNVETFKYLFKTKLFIIYASFAMIFVNVIIVSSMINSDLILTLYNGEITTIFFSCQIISVAALILFNLILMLKWTGNNNNNKREKHIKNNDVQLAEKEKNEK